MPWSFYSYQCVTTCVATRQACALAAGSPPCCAPNARCVAAADAPGTRTICAVPPTNPTGPTAVVASADPYSVRVDLAPALNNGGSSAGTQYRATLTEVATGLTLTKTSDSRFFTFISGDPLDGTDALVPELCGGKVFDTEGFWLNAAGVSPGTRGPRITTPPCPT